MRFIRRLGQRLRALLLRRRVDAELDEELRFHYDMALADAERRGFHEGAAQREVRRTLGGMTQAREAYRDSLGVRLADSLAQDVRYALRSLRRTPTFTIVALATLALGIGASAAMFSVVEGVLLRPLPFAAPDQVVMVWETDRNSGTAREPGSVPDYFDYAARSRTLAALGGVVPSQVNLVGDDGDAERVGAAGITSSMFAVLGVRPQLGRALSPDDDRPGSAPAAVISDRFWRSRFGGSASAIGARLRLGDTLVTVIGVLPRGVEFPDRDTDLWLPLRLTPTSAPRSRHWVVMVGRLAPGATIDQTGRELADIARQLESEHPRDNQARSVHVEPLSDAVSGAARAPLLLLMGAVLLLALIACANIASLLLARWIARTREVAVRTALGAGHGRLAQQFLVESAILAAAGGALGVAVAAAGVPLLRAAAPSAPSALPRVDDVHVDLCVLAATAGLVAVVAIVFGLVPAIAGHLRGDAREALGSGAGRTGNASRRHRHVRAALVVGEVALALVLATGAALFARSFARLRSVDPGFTPRGLVRLSFTLPTSRYPQSYENYPLGFARIIAFERELETRARSLPGVTGAAVAASDPITAGFTNSFVIEGREDEAARGQPELATRPVSPGYFATAGIPVVRGRALSVRDDERAPAVVVINRAAARRWFPDDDPVGRRIRFWGVWHEIVGVVGNEHFAGLASDAPPAMYPPIAQAPMSVATLLVRGAGNTRELAAQARTVLRALDPQVAPYDVAAMDEVVAGSVADRRFTTVLIAGFAAAALLLALVGVYGTVAYAVAHRTPELGIRVALGASPAAVVRGVMAEGLAMAGIGVALGVAGALGMGGVIAGQLYGIAPRDPATLLGAAAAVLVVALLATLAPARRAAGVSPATALRAE